MADVNELKPFPMIHPGNTCTVTGARIAAGEPCYARNADEVRCGMAMCEAEYQRRKVVAEPPSSSPSLRLNKQGEKEPVSRSRKKKGDD